MLESLLVWFSNILKVNVVVVVVVVFFVFFFKQKTAYEILA